MRLASLLLFSALAFGQQRDIGVLEVFTVPSGACIAKSPLRYYAVTTALYGCLLPTITSLMGTWGLVSGGTGPPGPPGPSAALCSNYVTANEGTSSTSYTDLATVDSCGFTLSGTTTIYVQYEAYENNGSSSSGQLWYNIVNVDGTDVTSPTSEAGMNAPVGGNAWGGVVYRASLASGAHTIKIRHKVAGAFTGFWTNRGLIVLATP